MPSKYQVITEMESEHLRTLTVDTNHYMDFLTTAANNFKYSFQEQLLIFAQKPDATACAEVSWWNKHGRWVNRNTKGIALLVDTDAPYKLRHVFDVSDTNSRAGKEVSIWKLEQRFIEPVRNVLAERYEVDAQESLEDCLLNVAVTFVNDNYQDYLAELMEAKAGSLLEKLDEDNTRLQMLTALSYSVGYMLHIRCGLPGRAYFGNSLDKVCNFNTPEVISILGAAVSDMSEVLLREIAVLVQDLQREERNQNRTFEVPADSRYDVNRTATTEGSAEYGSDLPQGGRVLPAGSDRAEAPKVGRYGMLRRRFLRENRNGTYTAMLLTGKLNQHLEEIDCQANEMMETLTAQMAKQEGVNESLKAENQMKWVGLMNNIQAAAEEIVLKELVYR